MSFIFRTVALGAALAATALFSMSALAADLPKPTQELLAKLKLPDSILDGIEDELKVPDAWVKAAEKEGAARINGSWSRKEGEQMNKVFHARFPKVKIKMIYAGSYNERAIKPLVSLREGRYITDAISGFGGSRSQYVRVKALEDLRPLPSFKNPIEGSDPDGAWAAIRLRYWCMAYNTKLVDKKQLPEKWEDILTNPYWHNQKIGVASRPQLWLAMLWTAHGKDWVMDYMDKLFTTVKPQHRKEGLSAVVGLVVAGEFVASMPSAQGAVKQMERRGAPVAWHCPSPVPTAVSRIAILKGNPNPNGTRIWVNWLLSKEGQLAQFAADRTSPSHRGLQEAGLMVYPAAIKGKKLVGEDFESLKPLQKAWNEGWERGGK